MRASSSSTNPASSAAAARPAVEALLFDHVATADAKVAAAAAPKPDDGYWQVAPDVILIDDTDAEAVFKQLVARGIDRLGTGIAERALLIEGCYNLSPDIRAAMAGKQFRATARRLGLPDHRHFRPGRAGIEHPMMLEHGLVRPGDLVIGTSVAISVCGAIGACGLRVTVGDLVEALVTGVTWVPRPRTVQVELAGTLAGDCGVGGSDVLGELVRSGRLGDSAVGLAWEFVGDGVKALSIAERMALAGGATVHGALTAFVTPDEATVAYANQQRPPAPTTPAKKTPRAARTYATSKAARNQLASTVVLDLGVVQPLVGGPGADRGRLRPVRELAGTKLTHVFIGGCTHGSIEHLRQAARILQGHTANPTLQLLITPSTPTIMKQAASEGLLSIFVHAGAAVLVSACGPCFGGHSGVVAAGEVALTTYPLSDPGRMGDEAATVYRANPPVAAASAIAGEIASL